MNVINIRTTRIVSADAVVCTLIMLSSVTATNASTIKKRHAIALKQGSFVFVAVLVGDQRLKFCVYDMASGDAQRVPFITSAVRPLPASVLLLTTFSVHPTMPALETNSRYSRRLRNVCDLRKVYFFEW